MKWLLIPLGMVTGLLLLAPQLVVVGLYLLIIPGMVMLAVPTVFVYLLGTYVLRYRLPIRHEFAAGLVALGLALLVSAAVMLPWRLYKQHQFARAALPDVVPAEKLSLTGDIRIELPDRETLLGTGTGCDYLCTALLEIPGVTSVTRSYKNTAVTFRRGAQSVGELVMPEEPQRILQTFAKQSHERGGRHLAVVKDAQRDWQAEWALRIAHGDALWRENPIADEAMDWTIRWEYLRSKDEPQVERLEIRDATGSVLVRRSLVQHWMPAPLFCFGFVGGSAVDGFSAARFVVGGTTVSNHERYYDFDAAVELLRSVIIPKPNPAPNATALLEKKLLEVFNAPHITQTEVLLAPLWLKQFRYDAGPDQIPTISKILQDERLADPAELLRQALSSGTDLTALRAGLVRRYLAATDPKSKSWYIEALMKLADGTFAQPTDDEQLIWKQAFTVSEAAPFVARMADQGADSVDDLLALLEESLEKPWHARWRVLRGLCEACKRLGPKAAAVVPRIRSLIETQSGAILNSYGDRKEWLLALHLMGVDAADLPFSSRSLKPDELSQEILNVQRQAKRYRDPKVARRW